MNTPDLSLEEKQCEKLEMSTDESRVDAVLRLSRIFIQAEREEEIIHPLLRESIRQTGALGASYVPLDERGVPLSAISQGSDFSEPQINAWVEYLASPAVHGRCRTCNSYHPADETCPLLVRAPFAENFDLLCLHVLKGEEKLGVLNIYTPKDSQIDGETQDFLQILLNETALAIDALRMRAKERQKLRQLEAALQNQGMDDQKLAEIEINAILQERTRLAREFHDGLAQVLGYIKLQLAQMQGFLENGASEQLTETIERCHAAVADAYEDAREAIDDLHLKPLEENFSDWLRNASREFATSNGISVSISDFPGGLNFSPEIHLQLTRITQETLSNIRKHARASEVCLGFYAADEDLILEIQDNGRGLPGDFVLESSQHGLRSMRERAAAISAEIEVSSQPGIGTTVRLRIPKKIVRGES